MLKIGKIVLNGAPKVVVSFRDHVSSDVFRKIKSAAPDIAELRIDQYSSFEPSYVLNEAKKFSQFSSLATIRSKKEGGAWNLSEKKRLELFQMVMPFVNAIDIESFHHAVDRGQSVFGQAVGRSHASAGEVAIGIHRRFVIAVDVEALPERPLAFGF